MRGRVRRLNWLRHLVTVWRGWDGWMNTDIWKDDAGGSGGEGDRGNRAATFNLKLDSCRAAYLTERRRTTDDGLP